jgi:hypothetical protein
MGFRPSFEDGHLIVAAVRVLSHRSTKPPTPEDIAELIGVPADLARNLSIALGGEGVLKVVENPFEIRVEIADYRKLEDLPRESGGPTIADEIDEFVERKKKSVKETEKLLNLDDMQKKSEEKMSRLEEQMRKMKGNRPPHFED